MTTTAITELKNNLQEIISKMSKEELLEMLNSPEKKQNIIKNEIVRNTNASLEFYEEYKNNSNFKNSFQEFMLEKTKKNTN